MSTRRFQWFISAAVVVSLILAVVGGVIIARGDDYRSRDVGFTEAVRNGVFTVTGVDSAGPSAHALWPGDRLVSWNGDTGISRGGTRMARFDARPGDRVRLEVERDGARITEEIIVAFRPFAIQDWVVYLVNIVVWLATALFIGLSQPANRVARLAATTAILMALLRLILRFLPLGLIGPIHVVAGFHFFSELSAPPERRPRWNGIALGILYAAAVTVMLIRQPLNLAYMFAGAQAATALFGAYRRFFSLSEIAGQGVYLLAVLAIVGATIQNYRLLTDPDRRRRIRLVVFGSLLGIAPVVWWAVLVVLASLIPGFARPSEFGFGIQTWSNFTFVAVAVTVTYAIVKHQLFDIRVIIRMGVKYLLAKRALQVLLALPIVAIVFSFVRHRDQTIAEVLGASIPAVVVAVMALIALAGREPVERWIDRRFFREQVDREDALRTLMNTVDGARSERDAAALVTSGLERVLHPKSIQVWTRSGGEMVVTHMSNAEVRPIHIPVDNALLAHLERVGSSVDVASIPDSLASTGDGEWVRKTAVKVLIPLMGKDGRALGLIALGEKRSEEPYGDGDLKLLQGIGRQMGLVWENLHLERRLDEQQRIEREVLGSIDPRRANFMRECARCGRCYEGGETVCGEDGESLGLSLPVPRVLNGRYELERLLGRGGMGAVYAARDRQLQRDVAVKIALGAHMEGPSGRRFQREARTTAQLSHRNIIRIYDVGVVEGTVDLAVFLVMERVLGHTLRTELERRTRLDGAATAEWIDQILAGLEVAHAAGVVHRDLKPENVIASRHPGHGLEVRILDFGLAKLHDGADLESQLTQTGVVLGTLGYMSPEQFTGGAVNAKSDVFAVGVMIAEMLSGARPFAAARYPELLRAVLFDPYHLPDNTPEGRGVDEVLQACLAKEPADRPDASEMRRLLVPRLRLMPAGQRA